MNLLINVGIFQVAWFAAVISASQGYPWVGALTMLAAILVHLRRASRPQPELILVLVCGVIGAIWDSVLVALGWISYPSGNWVANLAPYWIVTMWMLFATTLNIGFGWLKNRPVLAFIFGAVGGPLAFLTGHKLGGVVLVEFEVALIAQAVGWGLMMPILLELADRFDGVTEQDQPGTQWALD